MSNILIFIAKVIGKVWIFAAVPFRTYARNYVYNYVLQNNLPLKRLYERSPKYNAVLRGWELQDIHGVGRKGYIARREVNKFQFYLIVFFVWGWLDDDSNQDTTDTGYIKTLVSDDPDLMWYWDRPVVAIRELVAKLRKKEVIPKYTTWRWHRIFKYQLRKVNISDVVYGNSFDLGDWRSEMPFYNFWCTLVWNDRNTGMNFQYLWMDY